MQKIQRKVTWNDLHNATQHELKKTYKLSDRDLERQVRSHLDGASRDDSQSLYKTVYDKRR